MKINLIAVILLGGVTVLALEGARAADEPIQPVLRLNMTEIDGWDDGDRWWHFHRSADGELVLIGRGGPDGTAIASNDEGRTWHRWPDIHTWPAVDISAVTRRGNDLFFHPDAPDLRVYRSQDDAATSKDMSKSYESLWIFGLLRTGPSQFLYSLNGTALRLSRLSWMIPS